MKHFVKYALIGAMNSIVSYLTYSILLVVGLKYPAALAFSYLIGIIHSYAWNRLWNFRSRSHMGRETARFVSTYALSYVINLAILKVLIEFYLIQPFFAQLIAVFFVSPGTFLLMRFWVFQDTAVK